MQLKKITIGTLTSFLFLVGCAQTDKDLLAEAQYCLDKSTKETAAACVSKISSINSPLANALRCAQGFISAGVTSAENLSDAVTAIKGGSGATGMLAALSFPTVDEAKTTFNSCSASEQGGLALIGAMAKSATVIASIGGGAVLTTCSDPAQAAACQTALTNNMTSLINGNDPQAAAEIADSVGAVYDATCSGPNASSSSLCTEINAAATAAGVDPSSMSPAERSAFATQLLTQWQN